MCDICNSIFGHLSGCPEYSSGSGVYCVSCECELGSDDTVITFPNGQSYCADCVRELELYDLLDCFDVENALELIEKFDLCEITRLSRWQ